MLANEEDRDRIEAPADQQRPEHRDGLHAAHQPAGEDNTDGVHENQEDPDHDGQRHVEGSRDVIEDEDDLHPRGRPRQPVLRAVVGILAFRQEPGDSHPRTQVVGDGGGGQHLEDDRPNDEPRDDDDRHVPPEPGPVAQCVSAAQERDIRFRCDNPRSPGRSAAVAYLLWEQMVAGSIPAAPTNFDAACSSLNSCNRHPESGSNRRPWGARGAQPPA